MAAGATAARARAACTAWRAPRPQGSGADMWWASLLAPQPASATAAGARDIRNNAAASPRLMPSRLTLMGLHTRSLTAARAPKPATVSRHSVSTPPASTTSAAPASSSRAPLASAWAPEEQAVEIT